MSTPFNPVISTFGSSHSPSDAIARPVETIARSEPVQRPAPAAPATAAPRAAVATAPATSRDPMLPQDAGSVQIDTKRDLITSQVATTAFTSNADMFLTEGVILQGTHYGLELTSTAGVVILDKSCRLLPSPTRHCKIVAKRIAVMGEAVVHHLQADETLMVCAGSRLMANTILYGRTLVMSEDAETIVTAGTRKLLPREKRAEHVFASNVKNVQGAASFDEAVAQHYARIEEQLGDELVDEPIDSAEVQRLSVVGAR